LIREAKGVAIHDLSFWSQTLPLLDGLPRIIRHYQVEFAPDILMSLEPAASLELHNETLRVFAQLNGQPIDGRPVSPIGRRLAQALAILMASKETVGDPSINVPILGCGVVTGGSCDLLWEPYVVELKLAAKVPSTRDIRQILVYVALMQTAGMARPTSGLVANPRLGLALEFNIEELLLMTGGLSADEFASLLADFLVRAGFSN
jgi:hypothetical protein